MRISELLPSFVRRNAAYRELARGRDARALAARMRGASPLNVVIGSGEANVPGWFETDLDVLDITRPSEWQRLFEPGSIDKLLAEHVFEHLSLEETSVALDQCFKYLKVGALFRIAVPDGNRRDAEYLAEVSPPKDGHKVLYNSDSLTRVLSEHGFKTTVLEYFDESEEFHANSWNVSDGMIYRSVRFDRQESFKRGDLYFTSLIVDAVKQ